MVLVAAGSCALWAPAAAAQLGRADTAGPATKLGADFRPKRLGAPTTVTFSVAIDPQQERESLPVSGIEVRYPSDLGLATSGLGLESCNPALLEIEGDEACPADAKMGQGSALAQVPFGPSIVSEKVMLGIYAAPSTDGYLHLAILAHGAEPVIASIVLPAVLLPGRLQITVPPIASLPGAPNVALVRMQATIGGALTYYEHVHGRTVAYRPRGIGLPDRCPRGGWKVAARFAFTDGQSSRAKTAIPCPHAAR